MPADKSPTTPTIHLEAGAAFSPTARPKKKFASTGIALHTPLNFRFDQTPLAQVDVAICVFAFFQKIVQICNRTVTDVT